MLIEIGEDAPADRIDAFVKGKFARKEKISGFGHRVYRTEDPRATHLRQMSKQIGQQVGNLRWFEMSERIEALVKSEKKLYPNVDFYSASMYYTMGIAIDLYTPIFAVSRISGWTAHVLEQYSQQPADPPACGLHGPRLPADLAARGAALTGDREVKAQGKRQKAEGTRQKGRPRPGGTDRTPYAPLHRRRSPAAPDRRASAARVRPHPLWLRQRPHVRRWAGKADDGCVYRLPARLQARPRHRHRPVMRVTATQHRDARRRDDGGGHRGRGHCRGRGRRGRFPAQVRAHARACWNAPCATPRSWERPCANCVRWR